MAFAQVLELREQHAHLLPQLQQLVLQEELDVHEHLVVAGAPGVDLLAGVAQRAGQEQLDLGVDVLDILLQAEAAVLDGREDLLQLRGEALPFGAFQQPDAFQHPDVGQGSLDIVFRKLQVQDAVAADGECFDHAGRVGSFIP